MKLRNKILEAVHRSDMSIRHVNIRPLRDPESWGCKEEAYCVHILTHKRRKPDAESYWDCYEDELRLAGNGVVPQCAAVAFAELTRRLSNNSTSH